MTTPTDEHAKPETAAPNDHGASGVEATKGVVPPPPPLSPHLSVRGGKAAIAFYERAFGAKVVFRNDTPDGEKVIHASLVLPNGGVFMLHDDFTEMASAPLPSDHRTPITLNMDLPDVDAVWARAVEAGAEQVMPLRDQFWGDRYGVLRDPFGHRWALATRKQAVSQEQIAHATRNFGKSR